MPIMASQLVLATAAESGSLVLDDKFTLALPLVRQLAGSHVTTILHELTLCMRAQLLLPLSSCFY